MPVRFIVAALLVAALLAGALLWVGNPKGPTRPPAPLVTLRPADVRGIDLRWAEDGSIAASLRPAVDGVWVLRWKAGAAEGAWPAITSRVTGALGLLAKVQGVPGAGEAGLGDPVWLTLRGDATEVALRASKKAFGGLGVVAQVGGEGLAGDVDGQLVQVFGRQDVMAWRDLSAFPLDMSQASRVEIHRAGEGGAATAVRLARVGSRWGLVEPVAARAEAVQVAGFLEALKKLRVAKFPTEQQGYVPPEDSVFAEGLLIETDRNTPDGDASSRWIVRQRLRFGPFAGDQATLAKATVSVLRPSKDGLQEEILWGPTVILVDKATAEDVLRPAESFAARVATAAVAADVRGLRIDLGARSIELARSLDQWSINGTNLDLASRDAVRSLVDLITGTPALRVELADSFAPTSDAATVTLGAGDGPPLDAVKVMVRTTQTGTDTREELVIENAHARFIYSAESLQKWQEALARLGLGSPSPHAAGPR